MKKLLLAILSIVIVLFLPALGESKTPIDSLLIDSVPEIILKYEFMGRQNTSTVEDFKVIRQQTNGKDNYTEACAVLKSSLITRNVKLAFDCYYYDIGGWQVDSVSLLEVETIITDQNLYDEACNEIKYQLADVCGLTLNSDEIKNASNGRLIYILNLDRMDFKYLTLTGNITTDIRLVLKTHNKRGAQTTIDAFENEKVSNPELPMKYHLQYQIGKQNYSDDSASVTWHDSFGYYLNSNLAYDWKLGGEWGTVCIKEEPFGGKSETTIRFKDMKYSNDNGVTGMVYAKRVGSNGYTETDQWFSINLNDSERSFIGGGNLRCGNLYIAPDANSDVISADSIYFECFFRSPAAGHIYLRVSSDFAEVFLSDAYDRISYPINE